MQTKNVLWVLVLLTVAGGLAYWLLQNEPLPQPAPAVELPVPDSTPEDKEPRFPLPVESLPERPDIEPLPPLHDSDEYLRMDIGSVFGSRLADLMANQALIERIVATIDNLPRPQIAERVRPVKPLESGFVAIGQDGSGEFLLGRDNYERYAALVAQLQSVDPAQMLELYQRYYPLFQKAYEGLGYPDAYFNDRLIEVFDHLLATPEPDGSILLVRPNVLYEFADERLQNLSSGQKLLIRMGPENREKVLQVIREFRQRVAFGN